MENNLYKQCMTTRRACEIYCNMNVILYEKNNRCEFDNVEKINYC